MIHSGELRDRTPVATAASPSPYAVVGFWRNPFGELTRDERVRLAVVEAGPLLHYLHTTKTVTPARVPALQFLGDCGYGKTTNLLVLESLLPGARRVYYPETGPRPKLPLDSPVLIVDEAQRMGWWRRREMLKYHGPLVIGTHKDLTACLVQNGFAVWTIDVAQSKPSHVVADALNRRIAASLLDVETLPTYRIEDALAGRLNERFSGNLRRMEAFLYDAFQSYVSESSAWPPVV
ncbi:MAG: hypothetical protein KDA92_06510 [Planctomycetales bacterium]|nr:hypothetical protein [Planctomycetales bacterium]